MTLQEYVALRTMGFSSPPTQEELRRRYAALVRAHRPEEDPEGFQRIHDAFVTLQRWERQQNAAGTADSARTADPEETSTSARASNPVGMADSAGTPNAVGTPNSVCTPNSAGTSNSEETPNTEGPSNSAGAAKSVRTPDSWGTSSFIETSNPAATSNSAGTNRSGKSDSGSNEVGDNRDKQESIPQDFDFGDILTASGSSGDDALYRRNVDLAVMFLGNYLQEHTDGQNLADFLANPRIRPYIREAAFVRRLTELLPACSLSAETCRDLLSVYDLAHVQILQSLPYEQQELFLLLQEQKKKAEIRLARQEQEKKARERRQKRIHLVQDILALTLMAVVFIPVPVSLVKPGGRLLLTLWKLPVAAGAWILYLLLCRQKRRQGRGQAWKTQNLPSLAAAVTLALVPALVEDALLVRGSIGAFLWMDILLPGTFLYWYLVSQLLRYMSRNNKTTMDPGTRRMVWDTNPWTGVAGAGLTFLYLFFVGVQLIAIFGDNIGWLGVLEIILIFLAMIAFIATAAAFAIAIKEVRKRKR